MLRTALWLSLLFVAIVYGIYAVATVDRRGDEARIRAMVVDTTDAIGRRDVGGAVACLSRGYKDDQGMNYDRLRVLVAQSMRMDAHYMARSEIRSLEINGAEATLVVQAIVHTNEGGDIYKRDLTLHLTKEPTRHMGIIPTRVWRVTRVDNLGLHLDTSL